MLLLDFFKNNIDAFTVIGIFLTFFISFVSLGFTIKNNKAIHYVNSVTKTRVEWIDKLRGNVAEFLSVLDTQDLTYTIAMVDEIINYPFSQNLQKLNQIGSEIKLMLNFSDAFDQEIMSQIDLIIIDYKNLYITTQSSILKHKENGSLLFLTNEEIKNIEKEIEKLSVALLSNMQVYLKSEWNRVKYESNGKTYEKETQLFDIEELLKKKNDPNYRNDSWKRFCINSKSKFKRMLDSHKFVIIIVVVACTVLVLCIPGIIKDIYNFFQLF